MNIEPRRLRFNIGKDLPRYWNNNDPIKTHLFNAIAMLAPSFERLAIASILPYRNKITDPTLQDELNGFIGQESAHGSEFIRFNQILRLQGYDSKSLEKSNIERFKWLAKFFSPRMHLAFTLAAEHVTAIISDALLREPEWLAQAEPSVAALWRWHAIEEIEHKAVAYDVYDATGGGYGVRLLGMIWMLGVIQYLLTRNFLYLVKKDKLLLRSKTWVTLFVLLWGKKGFLRKLFWSLLRYFIPFFHPWKQNNFSLIMEWKRAFSEERNLEKTVEILKISAYTN